MPLLLHLAKSQELHLVDLFDAKNLGKPSFRKRIVNRIHCMYTRQSDFCSNQKMYTQIFLLCCLESLDRFNKNMQTVGYSLFSSSEIMVLQIK